MYVYRGKKLRRPFSISGVRFSRVRAYFSFLGNDKRAITIPILYKREAHAPLACVDLCPRVQIVYNMHIWTPRVNFDGLDWKSLMGNTFCAIHATGELDDSYTNVYVYTRTLCTRLARCTYFCILLRARLLGFESLCSNHTPRPSVWKISIDYKSKSERAGKRKSEREIGKGSHYRVMGQLATLRYIRQAIIILLNSPVHQWELLPQLTELRICYNYSFINVTWLINLHLLFTRYLNSSSAFVIFSRYYSISSQWDWLRWLEPCFFSFHFNRQSRNLCLFTSLDFSNVEFSCQGNISVSKSFFSLAQPRLFRAPWKLFAAFILANFYLGGNFDQHPYDAR